MNEDELKFYDYFESVGMFEIKPTDGKKIEDMLFSMHYFIPEKMEMMKLQKGLLDSFPIKNNFYKKNIKKIVDELYFE